MLLRTIIGIYFSIFASISSIAVTALIALGSGNGTRDSITTLTFIAFSLTAGIFTFLPALYFSNGFIQRRYSLMKSMLIGVEIMLISLLLFFLCWGVMNFIDISDPTYQEVIFFPIGLYLFTLIYAGVILFPTAAVSGAVLQKIIIRYSNTANKSLSSDAQETRAG